MSCCCRTIIDRRTALSVSHVRNLYIYSLWLGLTCKPGSRCRSEGRRPCRGAPSTPGCPLKAHRTRSVSGRPSGQTCYQTWTISGCLIKVFFIRFKSLITVFQLSTLKHFVVSYVLLWFLFVLFLLIKISIKGGVGKFEKPARDTLFVIFHGMLLTSR